jgi:hypothetical protein
MRHVTFTSVLLAVGLAITGCGDSGPQTVPTLAQLPTVTATTAPPAATAAPTDAPTEEVFFTPTPADDQIDPALATPTPITESGGTTSEQSGECSPAALNAALNNVDLAALSAQHTTFMTTLREAAAAIDDWGLSNIPDPLSGMAAIDSLPMASLRYQRDETQEAFLLVSPAPENIRGFFSGCISDAAYFRQGDVPENAMITIETLALGDRSSLATIIEPVDTEAGDSGIEELSTEIYSVVTGNTLLQAISIPALDEAMGQTPLSREETEALLNGLIAVVQGITP